MQGAAVFICNSVIHTVNPENESAYGAVGEKRELGSLGIAELVVDQERILANPK
jgi:hypothetical protein